MSDATLRDEVERLKVCLMEARSDADEAKAAERAARTEATRIRGLHDDVKAKNKELSNDLRAAKNLIAWLQKKVNEG